MTKFSVAQFKDWQEDISWEAISQSGSGIRILYPEQGENTACVTHVIILPCEELQTPEYQERQTVLVCIAYVTQT